MVNPEFDEIRDSISDLGLGSNRIFLGQKIQ